jgi:hypothetical protein
MSLRGGIKPEKRKGSWQDFFVFNVSLYYGRSATSTLKTIRRKKNN